MVAGTSSFISFRALLPNVSTVDRLETLPTFAFVTLLGADLRVAIFLVHIKRYHGLSPPYTPGPV